MKNKQIGLKKLKKSSLILAAAFVMAGSGVTAYAAVTAVSYSFKKTFYLPIEDYEVCEGYKYTNASHSSFLLEESNCTVTESRYWVRLTDSPYETVSTNDIRISHDEHVVENMYYKPLYNAASDVTLMGHTGGGETGYYVEGLWWPNGIGD